MGILDFFSRKRRRGGYPTVIAIDKGPEFGPLGQEALATIAQAVGDVLTARFPTQIEHMSSQIAANVGKLTFVISARLDSPSQGQQIANCVQECLEHHKQVLNR